MPRRGRDGQLEDRWIDPNPLFNAQFAASVFQHLPIEAWCQSDIYQASVAACPQAVRGLDFRTAHAFMARAWTG